MSHYLRTVEVEALPGGARRVTQAVEFRLAVPFFAFLFVLPVKRVLGGLHDSDRQPWWAPPDRIDARASSVLGALAVMSVVGGYLGALLSQTITFAADEFHVTESGQALSGFAVRVGGMLALFVAAVADRRGRRWVLLAAAAAGCVLSATGAASPSLEWLTASQVLGRTLAIALLIVVGIVAAEEMPAGSRAYAVSVLGMTAAFGAGVCVAALPLADLAEGGWRLLYVLSLVGLPVTLAVARHLPETRRFQAPHPDSNLGSHRGRFWLLAVSALLYNLFAAPASFFLNRYLSAERGFSATAISVLTILTNLPGAIGIVVGGRLADVRGRRRVGAAALAGGTAAAMLFFSSYGWPLWLWSAMWSLIGAAALPALGVYGPELFPTSLRGRANGLIAALGLAGSATGLLAAGYLLDTADSFGATMAVLGLGPLALAGLVLLAYPETAHMELEDLNPEDLRR